MSTWLNFEMSALVAVTSPAIGEEFNYAAPSPFKIGDRVRVKRTGRKGYCLKVLLETRIGFIEALNVPGREPGQFFDYAVHFGHCNYGFSASELELDTCREKDEAQRCKQCRLFGC